MVVLRKLVIFTCLSLISFISENRAASSSTEVLDELSAIYKSKMSMKKDYMEEIGESLERLQKLQRDGEDRAWYKSCAGSHEANNLVALLERIEEKNGGSVPEKIWQSLKRNLEEKLKEALEVEQMILSVGGEALQKLLQNEMSFKEVLILKLKTINMTTLQRRLAFEKGLYNPSEFLGRILTESERVCHNLLESALEEDCYELKLLGKALPLEDVRDEFSKEAAFTMNNGFLLVLEAYVLGLTEKAPGLNHSIFSSQQEDFEKNRKFLEQIKGDFKLTKRIKNKCKESKDYEIYLESKLNEVSELLEKHPFKKLSHFEEAEKLAIQELGALNRKEIERYNYDKAKACKEEAEKIKREAKLKHNARKKALREVALQEKEALRKKTEEAASAPSVLSSVSLGEEVELPAGDSSVSVGDRQKEVSKPLEEASEEFWGLDNEVEEEIRKAMSEFEDFKKKSFQGAAAAVASEKRPPVEAIPLRAV